MRFEITISPAIVVAISMAFGILLKSKHNSETCLDFRSIPKAMDIATTIAGEIVISKRIVDIFRERHITGAEFARLRYRLKSSATTTEWFQLLFSPEPQIEIV